MGGYPVVFHADKWRLDLRARGWNEGMIAIHYCPDCGEKLEAPDVKVDIFRNVAENWIANLEFMIASIKRTLADD
jgi:hypothetical protein